MDGLSVQDRGVVRRALGALPARVEEAKRKEMGEMMGKLKEVRRNFFFFWGGGGGGQGGLLMVRYSLGMGS